MALGQTLHNQTTARRLIIRQVGQNCHCNNNININCTISRNINNVCICVLDQQNKSRQFRALTCAQNIPCQSTPDYLILLGLTGGRRRIPILLELKCDITNKSIINSNRFRNRVCNQFAACNQFVAGACGGVGAYLVAVPFKVRGNIRCRGSNITASFVTCNNHGCRTNTYNVNINIGGVHAMCHCLEP